MVNTGYKTFYTMSDETNPPTPPSKALLQSWLNKTLKVKISDGRRLIGSFLCTDQEMNIILGSCQEFVHGEDYENEDPRILGLAMIPGKHIVSLEIDEQQTSHIDKKTVDNDTIDLSTQIEQSPTS
ncbi:N-alpha-acetyltransferase 38, NatC auxiliary subunit-like [Dendronephthya gigantea]|uniref:N-alpha-acetyltransferase 38, NatC auxiliary subunit-like n=1 Tax=Dendronephthya gigantea TaxID=151771 RepID=UPI00106AB25E|nr:N-alpha-acetyltransferase 38, NatC auxiliary subunit-like [Dendronephthya gigantea]